MRYANQTLTIKAVNKRVAYLGYELVKAKKGYFYFTPLDENHKGFNSEGVYVFRLNDLSLDEWIGELLNKIRENL